MADATDIDLVVKRSLSADPIFTKTEADGIAVDTPSEGYLRVTLAPADTEQAVGMYFMALQITWDADTVYECIMKIDDIEACKFKIVQDMI